MSFYEQYGTLAILVVVGSVLYAVIMTVNRIMRPSLPSPGKLSTYECGVDPVGTGWSQMNIRYYVFAFLFVIFDVEAIFLFPWALVFERLGTQAFVEMVIFIGIFAPLAVWRYRTAKSK